MIKASKQKYSIQKSGKQIYSKQNIPKNKKTGNEIYG